MQCLDTYCIQLRRAWYAFNRLYAFPMSQQACQAEKHPEISEQYGENIIIINSIIIEIINQTW